MLTNEPHARVFKLVQNKDSHNIRGGKSVLLTSDHGIGTSVPPVRDSKAETEDSDLQLRIENASGGAIFAHYELLEWEALKEHLHSEHTVVFLVTSTKDASRVVEDRFVGTERDYRKGPVARRDRQYGTANDY